MSMETVWTFETARFRVSLEIEQRYPYRYDGDDEDGETQAALDCGDAIAFDSAVRVTLDGTEVGADYLCGSVYEADRVSEFWTAHRDRNPMNRNCTIMRAAHGENMRICHYFPDMVREAIRYARERVALVQSTRLRAA